MLTRVHGVSDPAAVEHPGYAVGLNEAVRVAINFGLSALETGRDAPAPPVQLLIQARRAAQAGVPLDTVLRRYFACYSLLTDYLVEEAERAGLQPADALQGLLRSLASVFDQLVETIASEFADAESSRYASAERRRAERVRRLLAGQLVDMGDLRYDFDACHLGVVASGAGAPQALRALAATLDRSLLLVSCDEESVWAWFGGRSELQSRALAEAARSGGPDDMLLAIGEPGQGINGWRRSHRQALVVMGVAQRGPERIVRYAESALLAAALRDDLLCRSLREIYLEPLEGGRDGGAALRQTLAAYFSAGHRTSSAAAALGVSRQTVNTRLREVEERIGRALESCAAEMEIALRL